MIFSRFKRNPIRSDGKQNSHLELAYGRLVMLMVVFFAAYAVLALRVVDLMVIQAEASVDRKNKAELAELTRSEGLIKHVRRGNIYDRNGVLLATSLKTPSLYADPELILNKKKVAKAVADLFPDLSYEKVFKEIDVDGRYAWLRGNLSPEQQYKILEIGEPGLAFEYADSRIYPLGDVAAHMVGYTDRDNRGLAGIERSFNEILERGKDVNLTIDIRLQHALRREVQNSINDFTAKAGMGLIMHAKTGEVIAAASLPDYDLNFSRVYAAEPKKYYEILLNRLTLGVYEQGSVFKIFTTAALFETQDTPMSHTYDARKPLKVDRFTINDYHAKKRVMTVPDVFINSSNIGSALMAQHVGEDNLKSFFSDLGLMEKMDFDIREVGAPILPNPWANSTTATISYGHGLSVTAMQVCAAMATVVNGGFRVKPKLTSHENKYALPMSFRILSEDTSEKMRKLLRLNVTNGTGKSADIEGYYVGGKTGTAEKSAGKKGYDRKRLLSSFIAAFPMDDPEYIVYIMIDEPKGNKKSYGYATGGWVAAPAVGNVISSMVAILGVKPDPKTAYNDIGQTLVRYLHPDDRGGKKLASYR